MPKYTKCELCKTPVEIMGDGETHYYRSLAEPVIEAVLVWYDSSDPDVYMPAMSKLLETIQEYEAKVKEIERW